MFSKFKGGTFPYYPLQAAKRESDHERSQGVVLRPEGRPGPLLRGCREDAIFHAKVFSIIFIQRQARYLLHLHTQDFQAG